MMRKLSMALPITFLFSALISAIVINLSPIGARAETRSQICDNYAPGVITSATINKVQFSTVPDGTVQAQLNYTITYDPSKMPIQGKAVRRILTVGYVGASENDFRTYMAPGSAGYVSIPESQATKSGTVNGSVLVPRSVLELKKGQKYYFLIDLAVSPDASGVDPTGVFPAGCSGTVSATVPQDIVNVPCPDNVKPNKISNTAYDISWTWSGDRSKLGRFVIYYGVGSEVQPTWHSTSYIPPDKNATTFKTTVSVPASSNTPSWLVTANLTDGTRSSGCTINSAVGGPSDIIEDINTGGRPEPEGDDCGCTKNKDLWDYLPVVGGVIRLIVAPKDTIQRAICQATCAVSKALGGIVKFFIDQLINVSGVSVNTKPIYALATTCWLTRLL